MTPSLNTAQDLNGMFNVVIPPGFSLSRHSAEDKKKIFDECIEKIRLCERSLVPFYGEYNELCDMWRVRKRTENRKDRPAGLFNSRVGEMHRAVEALATFWYRVVTGSDPFFEAKREGLDQNGYEIDSMKLYGIEQLILKQLTLLKFKPKLMTVNRSASLFGTVIVEEPWVQKPITGQKYFEGTDFILSPLIKTFFDPTVSDIEMSDFIAKADYVTKSRLLAMCYNDSESWDQAEVDEGTSAHSLTLKADTGAWQRIIERKSRAGYSDLKGELHEIISYYGRLSKECIETALIQDLWRQEGDPNQDPMQVDFTFRFLNGGKMVCAFPCQYGDWHTAFKTVSVKQFELEPLGYGSGRVGKKGQNEMDFITSNANNLLTMSLYNMWKVSRYANLKSNQLGIKPLNIIEMEDISQLDPLRPDSNAIAQAINVLASSKSDFRSTTGASEALQAMITKASATEASLVQNEAVRSASVHGELLGEILLREHIETCYLNNLNLLDNPIWVTVGGIEKPQYIPLSKQNLPLGVGFSIKITSDKDFNDALKNATATLQLVSSIRQFIPNQLAYNAIDALLPEIIRLQKIDPKLLRRPIPVSEDLQMTMRRNQLMGGGGGNSGNPLGNENASQVGDELAGGLHLDSTPMGAIPTSSNNPNLLSGAA